MTQSESPDIQLPLKLYPRRARILAIAGGFLLAAIFMFTRPPEIQTILCGAVAAFISLAGASILLPGRTYLLLSEQGIEIGRPFGRPLIVSWREVADFRPMAAGSAFRPNTIGWEYKASALDKPFFGLLPRFYFRRRDLNQFASQLNVLRQRFG